MGEPVLLKRVASGVEAEMIADVLKQVGIPTLVRRAPGFEYPGLLAAGPREVLVRASDLGAAQALVESLFGLPGAASADSSP